jgi:hypothetical protein
MKWSNFDAILGQFDVIQPRFEAELLGSNAVTLLES